VSDKTDFGNDRLRSLQWNSPLASEIWLCQVKSSCRTVKLPYWAVAVVKTVCKMINKSSRLIWFAMRIICRIQNKNASEPYRASDAFYLSDCLLKLLTVAHRRP